MTDLSPDAQLLLLIMASHGGSMTKADAEAEFHRVRTLSPEDRAAYVTEATGRARTFATLRRLVDADPSDGTPAARGTGCDHKFIDSPFCLKCGWNPNDP